MALETTLTIDGITTPDAPIRVPAWSFGVSSPVTIGGVSGGGAAGKANFQDLSVTKPVDETSLRLLRTLTTGDNLQRVDLVVSDTARRGDVVLSYTFRQVLVTSLTQGGSAGGSPGAPQDADARLLTENVSLAFGSLGGRGPSDTDFGWDLVGNKPT